MDVTGIAPQAQEPTVEQTQTVEAPKEDSLAPKFAALAKKEKWIRKMQEDVKKQQEQLKARETEYQTGYVPKSRIKEDFMNVAMEAGLTADQIANILLSQSPQTQVDPGLMEMRNEIKQLKAELLQTKTGWEEGKKTEYNQALNQIRTDATKLIENNPDFETIKAKGLVDKVVEYIESTYKEDGILLSTEEAAREVEEALIEDALAAFSGSKRVQERLKALTAPKEEEQKKLQTTPQQQPKTLTNGMSPSSKTALSMRDRVARAKLIAAGIDPDSARV